jgi:hypothetical protein
MKLRIFLIASLLVIIVAGMVISQRLAQPVTPGSTPDTGAAAAGNPGDGRNSTRPMTTALPVISTNELTDAPTVDAGTNASPETIDALEARRVRMAGFREWASTNFDAALAFVQQLPDGDEKTDALEAVCFGLAQKDPALAMTKAQELQEPAPVVENLAQQWADRDMTSTLSWAHNQPAGDMRDEVFQRIALVLSQRDPLNAANLVLEQVPAGPNQNEAIMTVLHQWANKDLTAAVNWVKTFPDDAFRERALQELEGIAQYQHDLAHPEAQ